MHLRRIALLLLGVATAFVRADVMPAPLFRDGAVLQRDKPVTVWGRAEPGEPVRVEFAGQARATAAGVDGRWKVTLAPLRANSRPAELLIRGRNTVRVADVLVGEVWLCSGQSNMNFRVESAANAGAEIAASRNPLIRIFGVANPGAETPQETTAGAWLPAAPEHTGKFTAVGYFFARELQPKLGVPVGIVKGTIGGSAVEAWMSADTIAADPTAEAIAERWRHAVAAYPKARDNHAQALAAWEKERDAAKAASRPFARKKPSEPRPPEERSRPSGLYNSNIHPFIPYAIRGFLWYQGEGNAARPADYRVSFPAMIRQWRRDFDQGDLPFFFVQLASYALPGDATGRQWALQREAQMAALALPQTAMAVTIDIGEADDIHPRNKQDVGRRLALLARARVYGETLEAESPRATGFAREGAAMVVRFHAARGLRIRDGGAVDVELAGSDRKFHPAHAVVRGDTLVVTSPAVPEPAAVRYAWRNTPEGLLVNGAGLPVTPFRSDTW